MQNPRENLEEEIKRLTNEVASLKKDHLTPPCVNRYGGKLYQLHRRLSRAVTITKWSQKTCKRDQQKNQATYVLEFIQKTMEALLTYKKQFQRHLDIEMTLTKCNKYSKTFISKY